MSWWIFGKKEEKVEEPVESSISLPDISVESVDNTLENIGVTKELQSSSPNFEVAKKSEPFFVRMDKFQDTRKNLSEVVIRLKDMERILEKITEAKAKEDAELASWKEETRKIKSYLSTIEQSLFNKIQF
ncbi:hypothetical protein J4218_06460 [Candidatus Pacearchaeota archaeon]|nr:hypothetical protein [Candidatus Pacearchaeota archaeon]